MAKFTEEQIEILNGSPHVALVTESTVSFTSEFKQYLLEQKKQGRRVRDVLRENGIAPEILGEKRLENLSCRLNRRINEGRIIQDKRKFNGKASVLLDSEMDLETRVRWLTHELEYTRQEVEFLKKLQMANTEARKQWELKHQPK